MKVRLCATLVLALLASGATAAAPRADAQAPVNPDAATLADFTKRLTAYVAMHQKLDGTLREMPADARPEQFIDHQRALAKLIQQERGPSKQGEIFPKPMRDVVRRLLAGIFRGPGGREIKHSILDEYTGNIRLQVNGEYPEGVPFATVPAQVLQALPKLPDVLEYRFVGKRLILLDVHAHLIVDFIEHVFP